MDSNKHSDMFEPSPSTGMRERMEAMTPELCVGHETIITDVKIAHAYVPIQKLCDTFPPITSLKNGTIFPELYSQNWANKYTAKGE